MCFGTSTLKIKNRAINFLNNLTKMSENEVAHFLLGSGCSRDVYAFEKEYVIKIPRLIVFSRGESEFIKGHKIRVKKEGIRQTKKEIEVYSTCDDRFKYMLNPIIAHGMFLDVPFVVMPRLKIASKDGRCYCGTIEDYAEAHNLCVPRGFYNDLRLLSDMHDLYISDMWDNTDNFGIDGSNKIFIADYGFGEEVDDRR